MEFDTEKLKEFNEWSNEQSDYAEFTSEFAPALAQISGRTKSKFYGNR